MNWNGGALRRDRAVASVTLEGIVKEFTLGSPVVDGVSLEIHDGEFMVLVGPSGCGKTTLLRLIAGIELPTEGQVRIDGEVVNDVDAADRDVAMVFQNYALYPHVTVAKNIAFPLRMQGAPKKEIDERLRTTAKLLGIEEILQRRPRELSGGQRQRVAMGRAIVRRPRVFLMDEPLSNLDAKLRVQMRVELGRLQQHIGVTIIYVTHDQIEAMTLGHRVAVINKGRIHQVDAPENLYAHPQDLFVASFIGNPTMNFLNGIVSDRVVSIGDHRFSLAEGTNHGGHSGGPAKNVIVGLRPEDLYLIGGSHHEDGPLVLATVEMCERLGHETYAFVRVEGMESIDLDEQSIELRGLLVARCDSRMRIAPGERLSLGVYEAGLRIFDPESGLALARL